MEITEHERVLLISGPRSNTSRPAAGWSSPCPHMGNYDLAGAWVIAKGAGSVTAVAERVKPESVYGRFVAFREGLGVEVLPASGGTSSAFGVLAQRLRAGKLVCLVCDRDVTGTGMEVEFFGEKARMMGGPAALAVQTGAALMPVILCFEGDHWGAHVHAEIPVPAEGDSKQKTAAMMQQVARLFEAGIRAHPQDWHSCGASSPPTSTPPGWPPPRARPVPGAVTAGHEGQPCPPYSWDVPPPLPEQSGWSPAGNRPGTRSS